MVSPTFDLKKFLDRFHASTIASFVTNGHGFILEVNQAAAELFRTTIEQLKNKSLISFGARRKATEILHDLIHRSKKVDMVAAEKVGMRPRGSETFRADITGEVLKRSNDINLIVWEIVDSDLLYQEEPKPESHNV